MKTKGTVQPLMVLFLLFFTGTISFAVPAQIHFQGMLEDPNGPVSDTVAMTFRLFDVEENGDTPLWEESQSVVVDHGVYNVNLGAGTTNPSYGELHTALLLNDDMWLEVQVAGEIMAPRQKVASVGFAIRAGTVTDGAITQAKLAANAVTTDKLADGSVTAEKVSGGKG